MTTGRRLRIVGLVLFVIALTLSAFMAPAMADHTQEHTQVCPALDTGHLSANNQTTWTITAPAGQVIVAYCVKAGSAEQGDGPESHVVDPPVTSLVISHTSGKSISHYSVDFEPAPDEECPEGTTGTPPDCEEPNGEEPNGEEPNGEEPEQEEDEVLGTRQNRGGDDDVSGTVQGRVLPFTGIDPAPFIALSGLLAASGATALVIARRK